MKIYLHDYIEEIDKIINSNKKITDDIIKRHLIKIEFFQHERLIHLLVTLFYGIMAIIFIAFGFNFGIFIVIAIILLIFLMFYVVHYFRLEKGVQYLYKQYDILIKK